MTCARTMLLTASALALLAATPALAQETPEATTPRNAGDGVAGQDEMQDETQALGELRVLDNAEKEARQQLGSSIITAEDIEKRPVGNDLSEIIRRQPGINLTGNSASGAFGNNRQIDIRGMGPENTFILVDGKPVQSRNAVRFGRNGERNSRGDTNWVPAEEVERIEILRGPAAARYGSGAAGGVINIITKGPATEYRGSLTGFVGVPEDGLEGGGRRANFSLAGPVADMVSFRVYGNYNKTDGDDPSLNAGAALTPPGQTPPGGREGVENKDINGLIRFMPTDRQRFDLEASYSRQGNEYAGEYLLGSGAASPNVAALIGEETNVLKRATGSLNYQGTFDFGTAKLVAQYEHTRNRRLNEGLAGSGEGVINTQTSFSTSTLKNWYVNGSLDVPFTTGALQHVATAGGEFRYEYLNDPFSLSQAIGGGGTIPGTDTGVRDPSSDAYTYAGFLEDNIILGPVTVTPLVRYDHHTTFGSNWSPGVSLALVPAGGFTIRGGISRAFKAPNLYQSNPNYLYFTMGNGCPIAFPSQGGGCYIAGNPDLDAERSVNKEVGVSYASGGWNATITYYRNDYDNKIVAGAVPDGTTIGTAPTAVGRVFRWINAPKAVVEGLEGNLLIPFTTALSLNTNGTYLFRNENTTTGELLAIVPEYTINSTLDWQVTPQANLLVTYTRYGKQEANAALYGGATPTDAQLLPREAYNLVAVNLNFRINPRFRLGLGVNNLFDKRLFRGSSTNGQGANNYNEVGRNFLATTTVSF